jgi:hypothetical protein
VPHEKVSEFVGSLQKGGTSGAVVGEVVEGHGVRIVP